MFDLTGQVAVITGSTKVNWRAIAEELARAGSKCRDFDRKARRAKKWRRWIVGEGHEAIAIPCHIGRRGLRGADREDAGEMGEDRHLYSGNAAINLADGPMTGLQDEVFSKVMDQCSQQSVAGELGAGRDGGAQGFWSIAILCRALAGLAARDFGDLRDFEGGGYATGEEPGCRVGRTIPANCIAPGLVKTDFARALWEDPEIEEGIEDRTALRRLGEPEDTLGAAVFLASLAGAGLRGETSIASMGKDHRSRVYLLREFAGPIAMEEVETPTPGPGEVLVKVQACGVCHSDLHLALGDWDMLRPITKLPLIGGHRGSREWWRRWGRRHRFRDRDRVGVPRLHRDVRRAASNVRLDARRCVRGTEDHAAP